MTAGDVSEPTADTSDAQEAPSPNALVAVARVTQLPQPRVPWVSICLTLLGMWPGAVLLARSASAAAPVHWRGYVDAGIALWKAIALLGVGACLGMHFGPILHRRLQAWGGAALIDAPMRVRVDSVGILMEGFASIPWPDIRHYELAGAQRLNPPCMCIRRSTGGYGWSWMLRQWNPCWRATTKTLTPSRGARTSKTG